MNARTFYASYGKRTTDLVGGLTLLVATAPLHAACALAVVVTSGRPVYYSARRAGRDGEVFTLHKFRTMRTDTEGRFGAYPPSDSVTPVGRFLRRSSLDEIPQLINVVLGDMSLVGPRPPLPEHVARYTRWQRRRLQVRPGVTGLAQIVYRNSAPWSRRIEKDIEYIQRITFRSDVRILLGTLPSVLRGAGQVVGQVVADVDDLGQPESTSARYA